MIGPPDDPMHPSARAQLEYALDGRKPKRSRRKNDSRRLARELDFERRSALLDLIRAVKQLAAIAFDATRSPTHRVELLAAYQQAVVQIEALAQQIGQVDD